MCIRCVVCYFDKDLRKVILLVAVLSMAKNICILVFTSAAKDKAETFLMRVPNKNESGEEDLDLLSLYTVVETIPMGIQVLSGIASLLDAMLLYGAYKGHRWMVKSWLHADPVIAGAYLLYLWQVDVVLYAFDKMRLIYTLQAGLILCAATVCSWILVRMYDHKLQPPDLRSPSITSSLGSLEVEALCEPDDPLPATQDSPPSYDVMMQQARLSTVSGSCDASTTTDKPLPDIPPPPYTSSPYP